MRTVLTTSCAALAVFAVYLLHASAQSARPQFEVASIKPSDPDQRVAVTELSVSGRLFIKGNPLNTVIAAAYAVREFQVLGGPGWIRTDRWDMEARAEEGSMPTKDQANVNAADPMALRLQSLLEDRFQLKIHRETRELPIYELTIAKSGLTMKLSEDQTPFNFRLGKRKFEGSAVEMVTFVQSLSFALGRTIVDKTGLKGLFDIKLQWMPDMPAANNSIDFNGPEVAPSIDPNNPSIFTALQEQLGLKLESARGPVEVLVVDSVTKPSEN